MAVLVSKPTINRSQRFILQVAGLYLEKQPPGSHKILEPRWLAPTTDRRLDKSDSLRVTASRLVPGLLDSIEIDFAPDFLAWLDRQGFAGDPRINSLAPDDPKHFSLGDVDPTTPFVVDIEKRLRDYSDDRRALALAVLARLNVRGDSGYRLAELALANSISWQFPIEIGMFALAKPDPKRRARVVSQILTGCGDVGRGGIKPEIETAMSMVCLAFELSEWKIVARVADRLSPAVQDILISAWGNRYRHRQPRPYLSRIIVSNPADPFARPVNVTPEEVKQFQTEVENYPETEL